MEGHSRIITCPQSISTCPGPLGKSWALLPKRHVCHGYRANFFYGNSGFYFCFHLFIVIFIFILSHHADHYLYLDFFYHRDIYTAYFIFTDTLSGLICQNRQKKSAVRNSTEHVDYHFWLLILPVLQVWIILDYWWKDTSPIALLYQKDLWKTKNTSYYNIIT